MSQGPNNYYPNNNQQPQGGQQEDYNGGPQGGGYQQNFNNGPQNGGGQQREYSHKNVGLLYANRTRKGATFYRGDFCGIQLNTYVDYDTGNISLQVPAEYEAQIKALISTFLDQSGLRAKQKADYEAYKAQKGQRGGNQGGYQQGNNQRPPYSQRNGGGGGRQGY
jgi:hypothetical protein